MTKILMTYVSYELTHDTVTQCVSYDLTRDTVKVTLDNANICLT